MNVRETGHQRRAVQRFKLVELGAVDEARDHFAHVVLFLQVDRDDAVEFGGVVFGLGGLRERDVDRALGIQGADDAAGERQCVAIVLGVIVRNAGFLGVHVGAAEILGHTTSPVAAFTSGGPPRKMVP